MSTFFLNYELVESSGLFDPAYYKRLNPDVAALNLDPLTHYLETGAREGRNPSEAFDTAYYIEECRGLGLTPDNPLVHFIKEGSVRGLRPSARLPVQPAKQTVAETLPFDSDENIQITSLAASGAPSPDDKPSSFVEQALCSPFADGAIVQEMLGAPKWSSAATELYLRLPVAARPQISRLFDREYYLQIYPDIGHAGLDPFLHFINRGCSEGRSPHPFVDLQYIRSQDTSLLSLECNPQELWDVLQYNLADPSPYFSIEYYRGQLTDSLELSTGYLEHFLSKGCLNGLRPNSLFDPVWYCRQLDGVFEVRSAMRHFILTGDRECRAPSQEFSSKRYLERNLDVADAGVPPFAHYLTSGRSEGRTYFPERPPLAQPAAELPDFGSSAVGQIGLVDSVSRYASMRERIDTIRQQQKDSVEARPPAILKYNDPIQACAGLSFPKSKAPKVSILIPVYNELSVTVESLGSILHSKPVVSYEVVVADDASTDPAIESIGQIKNLRYLRQPTNLGFLENCNAAFQACRGTYVLLFNNDAQLMPGALDALVATLDSDPNIAAAGPKILYPNGRLQEAGCTIDRDGVTTMVGLFADPTSPEFNFARDVHYCSGAALLIRRSEIDDVLFDREFIPAYCEDTDLCLRLLSKGRRVRYCPDAVVVHHLSVSTNRQSVTKRLQLVARNQQKLAKKWATLLEDLNRSRVICFYLPQYHTTPANDFNWGQGFTEWTNVAKAKPGYSNHYQPHLPADLGFYDLRVRQTIERQVALARRYGIEGFCVYYYNFGDHRALDQAFEAVVADRSLDFPYCVCWANENWTRHWDGGAKHIIFEQKYDLETLQKIIDDGVRYAADPRYLQVNGKPLFVVYRPMLLPDAKAFAEQCRASFRKAGFDGVHLVFVESMETAEKAVPPSDLGFDACIEFPPQGNGVEVSEPPKVMRDDFAGIIYDYEATVEKCVSRKSAGGKRYPAVFPDWDNTPRQPTRGNSFVGATPEAFQVYVEEKLNEMRKLFVGDERLLFVNAWNEWAEGAHLEPDRKFGHRWLEAIRNTLLAKSFL